MNRIHYLDFLFYRNIRVPKVFDFHVQADYVLRTVEADLDPSARLNGCGAVV